MVGKLGKALACLCAVLLLLTMLPVGILAEEEPEPTEPTVFLSLSEDGVLTVTGTGAVTWEVEKNFDPDAVRSIWIEEGITEIDGGLLSDLTFATSLHLPDSLKTIGGAAFWSDVALTEIDLPAGLETIGYNAFAETAISSITIPASVTTLDPSAFSGCKNLERVTLEGTETRNDGGALMVEQDGVLYAYNPDYGSASLSLLPFNYPAARLELPTEVGGYPLGSVMIEGAANLQALIFPDGINPWIGVRKCPALTELHLPEGLTTLDGYAIAECPALKTVEVPASVTDIGSQALGYDSDGKVEGFTVKGISSSIAELYAQQNGFAFESTGEPGEAASGDIGSIHWSQLATGALILSGTGPVPAYDPDRVEETAPWENTGISVTSMELKSGITAFAAMSDNIQRTLQKLVLGDTVTSVPIEALKLGPTMRSYYNLSTLEVDEDNPAFKTDGKALYTNDGKTLLYWALGATIEGYSIPTTVEKIGPKAFAGKSMEYPTLSDIPATVKEIGERAFLNTWFAAIPLRNPDVKVGERAFGYYVAEQYDEYGNVSYVEQPQEFTCTVYGDEGSAAETYAKAEGFNFVPFTVGGSCGIEGDNLQWELETFTGALTISGKGKMMPFKTADDPPWNEYGYSSVDIGNQVLSISDYAFRHCSEKLEVTGGEGLTSIGRNAFFDGFYINLESQYFILNGILAGVNSAFSDPSMNGRYEIPEGVTAIAENLFGARTIKTVTLPSTLKRLGEDALLLPDYIEGQTSIFREITLPEGIESIGPHAIGYKGHTEYVEVGEESIEENTYEKIEGYVIKGYSGTVAETYALENGFKFESLGTKITAKPVENTAISGKEITVSATTQDAIETLRVETETTFTEDFNKENNVKDVVYVDVTLKDTATNQEDHTQAVSVIIGYPSEMIQNNYWNYDYTVLHLNEATGKTEKVNVIPTKDGLLYQGTLSPFAIGYYEKNIQEDEPEATAIVTFTTGDGSDPDVTVVTVGEKLTKPADPTREGYTFGGWYAENSDKAWDFDTDTVAEDVTLTAKWTAIETKPSESPSPTPSTEPSPSPSTEPEPSTTPSAEPSVTPSAEPSVTPSAEPSTAPSISPSAVPSPTPEASQDKPDTGDDDHLLWWFLLLAASGIGIAAACAVRPRPRPKHWR